MPYLTGNTAPTEFICRRLRIPASLDLLMAVNGALSELVYPHNWQQFGTMLPQEAADLMLTMVREYFESDGCPTETEPPYWEDPDDVDDTEPNFPLPYYQYPWYDKLADWVIAGFLAETFTPEAGINYLTYFPRIRLAFRNNAFGAGVKILLEDLPIWNGDTRLPAGETQSITDVRLDLASIAQANNLGDPPWHLRVEHAGAPLGAQSFSAQDASPYKLEVIRGDIRAPELPTVYGDQPPSFDQLAADYLAAYGVPLMPFDVRLVDGRLEKTYDGTNWQDVGAVSGEQGANGRTPEFRVVLGDNSRTVQWKYTDEAAIEWRFLTTIQDGDDGLTFTDVQIITLAAGATATGAVIDGILVLGIPQGVQGLQGIQGVQGEQGIQGPPGAPGVCPPDCSPQPKETTTNNNEALCSGAIGLTDYLLDVVLYSITEVEGLVGSGGVFSVESVGNAIITAIQKLLGTIPFIDEVPEVAGDLLNIGISIVKGQLTDPDWREQAFCSLYCKAKAAGGFNEAVFLDWCRNGLPAVSGSGHFDDMATRIIGWTESSRRFWIYAQGTSSECALCTDCPAEWCYTFDFTLTDGGFTPLGAQGNQWGEWVSGSGWRDLPVNFSGSYQDALAIQRSWAAATSISRIGFEWYQGGNPADNSFVFILKLDGTEVHRYSERPSQLGNRTQTFEIGQTANYLLINPGIGNVSTGTHIISRVTLWGSGDNPFGADNC